MICIKVILISVCSHKITSGGSDSKTITIITSITYKDKYD